MNSGDVSKPFLIIHLELISLSHYKMKNIFSSLALLLVFFNSFGTVWYVKQNSTGSNNGSSWSNAFNDLQSGIGAAIPGDQIWVAQGVYKPDTIWPIDRGISFNLNDGVSWYGGFNGTETSIGQRNISLYQSILSGDIAIAGNTADNSYHVVKAISVGSLTRIDGFKIISGNSDLDNNISYHGAGLYSKDGSPTVANCTFQANHAYGRGGALAHESSGSIKIFYCTFVNNSSGSYGGAINVSGSLALIQDCNLTLNQSSTYGGALYVSGGTTTVDRCIISGNLCNQSGGAAYMNSICNISNTLIVGNIAGGASALYYNAASFSINHIVNCTIADNSSQSGSEAVYSFDSTRVSNCILWGNSPGPQQLLNYNSNRVDNCIIQNGYTCSCASNILTGNPMFSSPGNAGLAPFDASGYNYHVVGNSPAINAGNNNYLIINYDTYDLDKLSRVADTTVDIGAYEYQAVGIHEFSAAPLKIYPNPSTGKFVVELNEKTDEANFELYNAVGTQVYEATIKSVKETFDLRKYNPGIYFVKLSDGEKVFTQKLVIE
jgi:predicted outer membrane repeat protein